MNKADILVELRRERKIHMAIDAMKEKKKRLRMTVEDSILARVVKEDLLLKGGIYLLCT